MELKIILVALVLCFCQALGNFPDYDYMPDTITLGPMERYFKPTHPKAVECYKKQNDAYVNLTKKFAQNLNNAAKQLANSPLKKYKKATKEGKLALNGMAKTMNPFGSKVGSYAKKNQCENAVPYMQEARKKMEENKTKFFAAMKVLRPKDPKYVEGAENQFRRFRDEAERESKKFITEFEKCVKAE